MSSEPRATAAARELSAGGVVVRGHRPRRLAAGAGVSREAGGGGEHQGAASAPAVAGEPEIVVIVPTRRAADGSRVTCLPKGHLDAGETPAQAAAREVREEAGVTGALLCELGEIDYFYRRRGRSIPKSVVFFLFEYVEGDTADHDDEVEEARWVALADAQDALSYPGEREIVGRALLALDR